MKKNFQLIAAVLSITLLAGCTSFKTLEMSQDPNQATLSLVNSNAIQVGTFVQVTTKSGTKKSFYITKVTEDTLSGHKIDIPFNDIKTVEYQSFSAGKTILLAAAITAALLVTLKKGTEALAEGLVDNL